MRILYFSDLHIDDRAPGARTENYAELILTKLVEIRELAKECDVTICGGDLFHRAVTVTHRLVQSVIDVTMDWPGPLHLVLGNHDLPPEGIDGVQRAAIGVVLMAHRKGRGPMGLLPDGYLLDDRAETSAPVDGKHAGLIQLSPCHWQRDLDAGRSDLYSLERAADVDFAIKVAHGLVMPPPRDGWVFEATCMDEICTAGMDICLLGHTHFQQGPVKINGCWFVGPGAVARVTRSEANRVPSVLILTLEQGVPVTEASFELRPLRSALPAEEVFSELRAVDAKADSLFAGYVALLEAGLGLDNLSIEDAIRSLDGSADRGVMQLVREYVAKAEGE